MDHRVLPPETDCWPFILGKSMDELKQSLLYTTLELEYTRIAAKEEIERRDQQAKELLQLLDQACRERDEANDRCNKLLEKLLLEYNTTTTPTRTAAENATVVLKRVDSTSSECDSISRVSSSPVNSFFDLDLSDNHQIFPPAPPPPPPAPETEALPEIQGKLPEKGKLLQAVMNAGPLLQTLLLAGPLPQWRHPPPPLDSLQIPPVSVSVSVSGGSSNTDGSSKKRSTGYFDSGDRSKHQKVY